MEFSLIYIKYPLIQFNLLIYYYKIYLLKQKNTTTYNNYSEEISITKKSVEETDIDKKIISHSIL